MPHCPYNKWSDPDDDLCRDYPRGCDGCMGTEYEPNPTQGDIDLYMGYGEEAEVLL